eukprot:scaffold1789_cov375-Prasinococcus_capsulatus_cf.AAC.23
MTFCAFEWQVVLQAEDVTEENFAPFGQLVRATPDGTPYSPNTLDCELDLSQGTPRYSAHAVLNRRRAVWHLTARAHRRFYIMTLPPKGRQFDRITYHSKVTQCLGSLGGTPWYIAVAKASDMEHPPTYAPPVG